MVGGGRRVRSSRSLQELELPPTPTLADASDAVSVPVLALGDGGVEQRDRLFPPLILEVRGQGGRVARRLADLMRQKPVVFELRQERRGQRLPREKVLEVQLVARMRPAVGVSADAHG